MTLALRKPSGIRCFEQHGFVKEGEASAGNVYGRCPFCGKAKHFYVQAEKKLWDCKRCGKKGGFQSFLNDVLESNREAVPLEALKALGRDRGLTTDTLDHFQVGYNSYTDRIVVPIFDASGERVWDIRIYHNRQLISTADCHVGLFNWAALSDEEETVYICEGEWDGMALYEALEKTGTAGSVVAVPGAGVFKADWVEAFKDKQVIVLYDNDEAGQKGSIKVYNLLKQIAAGLRFIQWPSDTAQAYDIRDLYKERKAEKTIAFINEHLADMPKGAEDSEEIQVSPSKALARKKAKLDGEGAPVEEVYRTYRKWLHLPDMVILDFMFGTVIANRLPGDPLWGQLVGPSGATKTELIQSLTGSPMITTATSLTPHALVSGANFSGASDPSLIPQWNGQVVAIKDLTVILSMNQTYREEIFSILRDAYDGKTEKNFGNGVRRSYESKFGIIAGVTPIIEIFAEEHTSLGERFLRFPVHVPPTLKGKIEMARRAMNNTLSEDEMRKELKEAANKVLNYRFPESIEIPNDINEKVLHAAQLLALLRSTIKRDNFTKEITYKPFSEMATRLSKQFRKLIYGTGLFRRVDVADKACYEVVKRVVLGTIPSRMNDILLGVYRKGKNGHYDIDTLSNMSKLPPVTTQRLLDGLTILNVFKRSSYTGGLKPEWSFAKEALELIEISEIYKP